MMPKTEGIMRDVYILMSKHQAQSLRQIQNKLWSHKGYRPLLAEVKRVVSAMETRGDLQKVGKRGERTTLFAMTAQGELDVKKYEDELIEKRLRIESAKNNGLWGEQYLDEIKKSKLALVLEQLLDGPKTAKEITGEINRTVEPEHHLHHKQVGRILSSAKTVGEVERFGHVWSIPTAKKKQWSVTKMVDEWNEGGREAFAKAKKSNPVPKPSRAEKTPEIDEITPPKRLFETVEVRLDVKDKVYILLAAAAASSLTAILLELL